MKTSTFSAALATTALAAALGLAGAPSAFAETTTTTLGGQAELVDGAVVQGWTVKDLKPSSDVIAYPVHGVLWEATATDTAIAGPVTPIVSNFNARARNGDTYRVLFGVATPQGVNPATLAQGQHTTGKLYFDVIGADPDSVLYNAGGSDLLLWVAPPPAARGNGGTAGSAGTSWTPGGTASGSGASTTSTSPTAAAVPGQVPAQPASTDTLPSSTEPTGSSGTPLPSGSQGTPVGTPTPEAVPGGDAEAVPHAGGSQGTPVGAANQPSAGQPAPAVSAPAGRQGTPAAVTPTTTPIAPPPAA